MSWSPAFLHALADELERVQRRLDAIDRRIEAAKQPATKDRLTAERAEQVAYEKWLHRVLRCT